MYNDPSKHNGAFNIKKMVLTAVCNARGAASVAVIDISPEIAKIAQGKFPGNVPMLCGDVEQMDPDRR